MPGAVPLGQVWYIRGGGGGAHLLLALQVIWALTTHLLRDGAPFPLLLETPPTVGRSLWFIFRTPPLKHKVTLRYLLPVPHFEPSTYVLQ